MTIEISRQKSLYQYKIAGDNPAVIMVRRNIHNARWRIYGMFSSAETATEALLALECPDAAEGEEA